MKKVLIYVEPHFTHQAIDLLDVVGRLYNDEKCITYSLSIHGEESALHTMFDVLLTLNDPLLSSYATTSVSEIITQLHDTYSFDAILFLATEMGRLLAPSVAMRLHTGLVADVTQIAHSQGGIELIRPAYSGKIMAGIRITGNGPLMMSVRIGVFSYTHVHNKESKVVELKNLTYSYGSIKVKKTIKKKIPYDITESNVLISGGKGIESNMKELTSLASLLQGEVSASRAVVDKGIVSRAIQVGQSGKTVSPSLYIALGIHGAIQHIEGLKDVNYIISVNTNKNAPICSISDIVVVGDALTFIHKLVERIEKGIQS